MLYFTTFFDRNYLSRGLVMYESLKTVCSEPFTLFIVALDEFTIEFFSIRKTDFPEVIALPLSVLEKADPELLACKPNRSVISYYFTLSPGIPLFMLKKFDLPHICSLDADIVFYSDPTPVFNYLSNHSIIITPHKFSKENRHKIIWGTYNVSFQIFRNDVTGLACLEKWREQCINWCDDWFDQEHNRFADQKYLDQWPLLYKNSLKVLDDTICGLATWNLNNYCLSRQNGTYLSNGHPIIFYHFHGLKFLSNSWVETGFSSYKTKVNAVINRMYKDYILKLIHKKEYYQLSGIRHIREKNQPELLSRILFESQAYFVGKSGTIITVAFWILPVIIKKIIIKIYGIIN